VVIIFNIDNFALGDGRTIDELIRLFKVQLQDPPFLNIC